MFPFLVCLNISVTFLLLFNFGNFCLTLCFGVIEHLIHLDKINRAWKSERLEMVKE